MNHPVPYQPASRWRQLLIGIFLLLGFGAITLLSLGILLTGITSLGRQGNPLASEMLMLSVGLAAIGILMLPGLVLTIRALTGRPEWQPEHRPFPPLWLVLTAIPLIWGVNLLVGNATLGRLPARMLILPLANLVGIALPVLFYLVISLRGLGSLPARRVSSIFGAGMLFGPLWALILEALAMGCAVLGYIFYAMTVPGLLDSIGTQISALKMGGNDADISRLIGTLAFAPGIPVFSLLTFSVAVPIIEETLKSMLIWPFLGRLRQPREGFILGVLCGAAFAFTENMLFTSISGPDWMVNTMARATAALPHIFNSGMLGWALVYSWNEKSRIGRLAASFLAAVLVHGTWNAIGLGLALTDFASNVADAPYIFQVTYPWYAGLAVLTIGVFVGLLLANRQMRKQAVNLPVDEAGV